MDWENQTIQIGKNIKYYREQKKWSYRQLGEKVGVSHTTISNIEKGAAASPKTLQKLAEALGVHLSVLLASTNERQDKIKMVEDLLESGGDMCEALKLAEWLSDDASTNTDRVYALDLLARVFETRTMYKRALLSASQMLETAESLRSTDLIYKSHQHLAKVNWRLANYDQAILHLKYLIKHGVSPKHTLVFQLQLAAIFVAKERLDEALQIYNRQLPFVRADKQLVREAGILHNQADIYLKKGDKERALQLYTESYEVQQLIPNSEHLIPTTDNLFALLVSMDKCDNAREVAEKTFERLKGSKNTRIAKLKRLLVEYCSINIVKEKEYLLDAYNILSSADLTDEFVRVCVALGDMYGKTGDIHSAYRYYSEASTSEKKLRLQEGEANK